MSWEEMVPGCLTHLPEFTRLIAMIAIASINLLRTRYPELQCYRPAIRVACPCTAPDITSTFPQSTTHRNPHNQRILPQPTAMRSAALFTLLLSSLFAGVLSWSKEGVYKSLALKGVSEQRELIKFGQTTKSFESAMSWRRMRGRA